MAIPMQMPITNKNVSKPVMFHLLKSGGAGHPAMMDRTDGLLAQPPLDDIDDATLKQLPWLVFREPPAVEDSRDGGQNQDVEQSISERGLKVSEHAKLLMGEVLVD